MNASPFVIHDETSSFLKIAFIYITLQVKLLSVVSFHL